MMIESTRLGHIEVTEEEILKFPHGLPGFSGETAFAFIPYGPQSPFAFLQSVSEPNLTFLVVEPFPFFVDYEFELDNSQANGLGVSDGNPPRIFCIVTVPEKLEEMTANLVAPVVVNWRDRMAMQIVLDKGSYTTRHRLFPQGFPQKPGKGEK